MLLCLMVAVMVCASAPCSGQSVVVLADNDSVLSTTSIIKKELAPNVAYTVQLKSTFNVIEGSNDIFSIVDAGCTTAELPDLDTCNITTISCCRSYLTEYTGSLYTIVPSDELIVPGLLSVLNYHQWRLVKIFTENSTQFNKLHAHLCDSLTRNGITITPYTLNAQEDISDTIFMGDSHIFLLNTNYKLGLEILCKAHSKGLQYPNYAWILLNIDLSGLSFDPLKNCSHSSIDEVLNRSLLIVPYPDGEEEDPDTLYNTSHYLQDSIKMSSIMYQHCGNDSALNQQCIADTEWKFNGLTGVVDFVKRKRVSHTTLVIQYQEQYDTTLTIGTVFDGNITFWENESDIWPDGIPPDGTPIKVVTVLEKWITIYGATLTGLSVAFAVVCLSFNIIFRNKKVVKLISPNLNYIMILGAVMIAVCGIPIRTRTITTQTVDCVIDRLCSSLGYDICFSIALVKTIRVYYIFKRQYAKSRNALSDWVLILITAVILLGDIIIAHPFFIVGMLKNDVDFVRNEQIQSDVTSQGVRREYWVISCGTTLYYDIYLGLTVLYKIVLHVIGLILAFMTRKVEIDVLNDYKSTSAIVYCSSVLSIVLVSLASVLANNPNADEIGFTTLLFVTVMMFLGLTFVPKMIALCKDPKGKRIFKNENVSATEFSRIRRISIVSAARSSGILNLTGTVPAGTAEPLAGAQNNN